MFAMSKFGRTSFGLAGVYHSALGQMTSRTEEGIHAEESHSSIKSSIDSALSLLGDEVKQAFLYHVRERFQLKEDEFPHNPDRFGQALAGILGGGAHVLEEMIVQQLNSGRGSQTGQVEFAENKVWATQVELSFKSFQRERLRDVGHN